MFDIGFWEMVMIGLVSLLVIGPERLPKVARTLGGWVGKAQRYVQTVKSDIQREFDADDLMRMMEEQKKTIEQLQNNIQQSATAVVSESHKIAQSIDSGDQAETEIEEKPAIGEQNK